MAENAHEDNLLQLTAGTARYFGFAGIPGRAWKWFGN